ncbi:MAG: gliding motility-associated C-terminal domain-containing protein [Flavobacteriales bacterium]|nr:gliding motility-associated C-terminal domain-containing protein [Flavobacteriales bacterium]
MVHPALTRSLLVAFTLCTGAAAFAQKTAHSSYHWVGGDGAWSDAAHWSLTADGIGGAGVPHAGDDVLIAPTAGTTIALEGRARCSDLRVNGESAYVHIIGDARASVEIGGDWVMKGSVNWDLRGTVKLVGERNGRVVDLRGIPVQSPVVVAGSGNWTVISDMVLANGDLTLREGSLLATAGSVKARNLCAEGHAPKQFDAGRSVVLLDVEPDLNALAGIVRSNGSTLAVAGVRREWGEAIPPPADPARDVNVCGTGAGQTPFTATTSALTNFNGFNVRCRGQCNATITVNVTGGIGPFTYSWLFGGPGTQTWVGACGGPQIVVVTDQGQGVSCGVSLNVTEPAPLGVIFFGPGTPPTCADVCNGTRTALAIGGVPGHSYSWNNGAGTNSTFSQLCAGVNTLRITDANMCIFDTTFTFNLLPISPNLTFTGTSCFGDCDGTGTVNPAGGTPPFTITWTPAPAAGQGTPNATGFCAGNHNVLIADANGCDTMLVFEIVQPPPIVPNAVIVHASCFGACDGSATVTPTGSPGPFTFTWAPPPGGGQNSGSATGLCEGPYTVLITDQVSGCDTLVPIVIDAPPAIDVQGTVTDATCSDACNGSIAITISGIVLPYTIVWSPAPAVGQGTVNVSGLCAGPYQVTVTTPSGCDTTVIFIVNAPPPLDVSSTVTDASCAGVCDGEVILVVTGGIGPYNFTWTPNPAGGQGTPQATGLCAGPGSVLVTDANGCDTTVTFLVSEPPPLLATPDHTDVTCGNACDGTANVLVSGGTAPYTYVWSPAPPVGQGTNAVSGLCAGPISVLITDAHGCTLTVPFTILDAVPITLSLQVLQASCPGVCDGSAGVIAGGGVSPYTYVWSPAPGAGQGTPNATGLCPQAYTLTVADALGCDTTIAFTVPAPPPIIASGVVTDVTCAGDCNGSIVLTVSGGNGTFSYVWTPAPPVGQGTITASGLCAGPWNVTITSGACDTTLTFEVDEPLSLNASVTTTDPTCTGQCDGTGMLVITGGTAPYGMIWSPAPGGGQGTLNATDLCPGNYSVTVTDAAGCDTTITFIINDPIPIDPALVTTPASCGGACDGTATSTPTGGTGPYTYDWQPPPGGGQGTPAATGFCPGPYVLTITDAVGCSIDFPFAISTPSGINAVPTPTPASCGNSCDGSIAVVTSGGVPAYSYLWTPQPGSGQGTPNAGGLCPGIWTLQITDAAQCDTVLLITITAPPAIVPNESHTNENCFGPCNGTATVAPTGGQAPFTYLWVPNPPVGQGTPSASNLCPGIWSVLITDASGCDTTVVFDILPKVPVSDNLSITPSPCANTCGGTATATPSGGIPPYTYVWTPVPPVGQGTPTASGLCIGLWTIQVFDAVGCQSSTTFFLNSPPPITGAPTTTPETCAGVCSGTATVAPAGGTGNITIQWQPAPGGGQGTTTAIGLCAGVNYTVTLTDDNGCVETFPFTIQPFTAIQANSSSTPVSCNGVCDGTATVGPTGGQAPYTYSWAPAPVGGQGTPMATGLCAGVYTVTITDQAGCSIDADILITGPDAIVDNATVSVISCAAQCNGSVQLAPSGGVAPYSYVWSPVPPNGQGQPSATSLCAGTWNVTITDANGCTAPFSYVLNEPSPLAILVSSTPSECQVCIGTASVLVSGGTSLYVITWTNGLGVVISNDADVIDLCAGIYTVSVVDANGCSLQQAVAITDSNGEVLTTMDGTTSCPNTCDGSVSVSFNCADPACTVAWFDAQGNDLGQNGNSLSGLCPGDYIVQVTNASGCVSIDTATVIAPPPTNLLVSSSPVTCAGLCNGTATVGVNGGIPPYVYIWSPEPGGGQGTPMATGLCAQVYTVLISDGGGCDTIAQVLITEPLPLNSGAVVIGISCPGQCDANVTLITSGGTGPYTYVWSPVPPSGQGGSGAFGLCAGDWTVTITDANNCSITETYTIIEPQPMQVSVSTVPSTCPNCDGQATVTINGGTPPYDIAWTLGGVLVSTDAAVTDLCGGLYILTVSDLNGCGFSQPVQIPDANAEVLTPTNGQTTCANLCDGTVSVSFVCSTPPCNLDWFDALGILIAQNQLFLDNLCVGTYTAQVTNGGGCVSFTDASVVPSLVIIPNLSSTPVTCSGDCDGTATVGPTGGIGTYTYTWTPEPGGGQGTSMATGLCAGVYSVLIADAVSCDTTVQVLILGPTPLAINSNVLGVSCAGDCNGSVSVIVTGGVAPYTYVWSPNPPNGQGTDSASGLCAGTITLTVTDANACSNSDTYQIDEPLPLDATTSSTLSECGICNGTGTITPSGGTAPYFIVWTLGGGIIGTDPMMTGLCAGLYSVTITDANNCSITRLVAISDSDGEVTTMTNGITTCPGDCDGQVSVDFVCSDPACSIMWFDASGNNLNEPGNVLSNLCAGLYLVQVTNGTGCITIDTAFVTEPDPIVPNLSTTPVTCNGACDGVATVGPTGGQPPYDFLWDPAPPVGQGTSQASQLCAGTWSVTISDLAGCSIVVDVLILEPTLLTASTTVTPITCNGACDGVITMVPNGGTIPYSFFWDPVPSNGQGTDTADQLCAGDWSVTITDGNGCDTTYTFTLVDPEVLDAQLSTVDDVCFGDCQGTADVVVTGGNAPYSITWFSAGIPIAQDVTAITELCAGDYSVQIIDANGCSLTVPFTIAQGTPIDAGLLFTNETCFGPCDGTAAVSPTGGTGPYTYFWQPEPATGQGTEQVTGLCAGPNSVLITDALGCDTTYTFTVLPFQPIVDNASVSDVNCNGDCDGSIVTTPTGGIGAFTFVWSPEPPNGQGTDQATSLCPGSYALTITDGVGCDSVFTYTITEPTALNITVDQVTDASCADATDGAIAVTTTGGVPNYTLAWSGPGAFAAQSEDIGSLAPGSYTLVVMDANGCTVTINVQVNALITVVADAGADQNECGGVAITLDGSNSTGAVNYVWTDDQGNMVGNTATVDLGVLQNGTYTYTLTISDGPCTASDQVVLSILQLPIANAGPDHTIFLGDEVTLGGSPTGPQGSSYVWTPDSLVSNATVAAPTSAPAITTWFTVTVTSSNGCVSLDSVLVTVIPEVVIPTGFTPNGDGWNDTWVIDFIDLFPECEVEIYNRWGEMLFRSVGYQRPWEGKYNGGFVPVGTYYYVIKLNDPRFPDAYTGPLTVIR